MLLIEIKNASGQILSTLQISPTETGTYLATILKRPHFHTIIREASFSFSQAAPYWLLTKKALDSLYPEECIERRKTTKNKGLRMKECETPPAEPIWWYVRENNELKMVKTRTWFDARAKLGGDPKPATEAELQNNK